LKIFPNPAKNATGTVDVGSVSIITTDAHRRKEPYVSVSVVVARVEKFLRAKTMNVMNNIDKTVIRTKKQITCVS